MDLTRMTAAELSAALAARRGLRGRGDPGAPGPDRRRRRARARLPARRGRQRAGPGRRGRRTARPRRAARPAGRASRSRSRTCSPPSACRPPAARASWTGWHPPYESTVTRRLQAGRRDHRRQDQHGRVRHGLLHRELRLRAQPQPVGPGPDPGRLVRRVGRRGGRVRGAAGHRHRHRRLDPPARRGLRDRRHQAHLRRLIPVRGGGLRLEPGHAGTVRPDGARHRAAARGDVRARPVRLHLDRRAGAAGRGRGPRGRRERHADRRGHRAGRRGLPAGRPVPVRRGGRAARIPGRQGHRGVLPALQVRPARVLPDRAQRSALPTWPASTPCATGCGSATTGPGTPRK